MEISTEIKKVWKAKEQNITQETLADVLDISTGKVSQLMKIINYHINAF